MMRVVQCVVEILFSQSEIQGKRYGQLCVVVVGEERRGEREREREIDR